jgi:hypothetical protein
MKKNIFWILIVVAILTISMLGYFVILHLDKESFSETIKISLIASLTAIISIIGSVFVNQHLSNENSKQQRAVEIRIIKQEYYHKFTESFLLKMTYLNQPDTQKYLEADRIFCLEKNRLPLYASQEIVELVESVARGANVNFTTLFDLIRKDLCRNDFIEFSELKEISVTLPKI